MCRIPKLRLDINHLGYILIEGWMLVFLCTSKVASAFLLPKKADCNIYHILSSPHLNQVFKSVFFIPPFKQILALKLTLLLQMLMLLNISAHLCLCFCWSALDSVLGTILPHFDVLLISLITVYSSSIFVNLVGKGFLPCKGKHSNNAVWWRY